MKKVINCLFVIFVFSFMCIINTNAECSYQERKDLLNKAKSIDISVEPKVTETEIKGTTSFDKDEQTFIVEEYSFDFVISNLSDDLYIRYYTSLNTEDNYITSADLVDGIYRFNVNNSTDLITYYFNISTFNENCKGETIKTTNVVKPIFNNYSNFSVCSNEVLKNKDYCKKFITKELNLSESEFFDKVNKILNETEEEKEKEEKLNLFDLIKKYWVIEFSILGVILIVVSIIIIHKRRSRLV